MKTLQFVFCVLLVALLPTPIRSQGTCRCQNNGVCLYDASGAGIRCLCPAGYSGILCEEQEVDCQCQNGGLCRVDARGDYECLCPPRYHGVLCQYVSLVEDNTPPTVFNCPSDFEARRQAGEMAVFITWEEPYATDNSGQTPSVARNIAPNFYAVSNYEFQVIYRYTDQVMLTADCRFTVTVIYSEVTEPQPVYSGCPGDIIVTAAAGAVSTTVTWVEPTVTPSSQDVVSVERSHTPGSAFFLGSTVVTYTFTAASSQMESFCTFMVTVLADTCQCENGGVCIPDAAMTGIRCQCPAGFTGILCDRDECQCQNNGVCQYDTFGDGIRCECPAGYTGLLCEEQSRCDCENGGTCIHDPFRPGGIMCMCPPEFTGILCQMSTSSDVVPPTVTFCPNDFSINPTSDEPIFVTWPDPQAVDNSGVPPTVVQNIPQGTFVNVGDVLDVVYRFIDAAGNVALCEFTVTAVDDVDPVITFCPADIEQMAPSADMIMFVTWAKPRASDNSGKPLKVSASAMPGTFVVAGSALSVSYVFTDESGNQATCTFNIVISAPNVPVITNCPVDVVLNITDPSGTATGIWAEPTASNGTNDIPVFKQSHQSGSSFGEGTTIVSYIFTDAMGNEAECSFTVTVIIVKEIPDPPVSVDVANITTSSAVVTWVGPSATFDSFLVTTSSPSSTTTATVDPSQESLTLSDLTPDTNYTVEISTVVGADADQVVSTPVAVSFKTVAVDSMPPTITDCPDDITLPAGQNVANWMEPTAEDDSGVAPVVDKTHEPGAVFADEVTNVTYTFTDATGNSAQCVFTVTRILVLDPPLSVSIINVTTSSVSFALSPPNSTFDVYVATIQGPLQTVEVTFPAQESTLPVPNLMPDTNYTLQISTAVAYGTDSEVVSTPVTLRFTTVALDTTPPVITDCPSDVTLPVGQSTANWTEPTAVDDSGMTPVVDRTHEPGAVFVDEVTNVTYTFTDAAGNSAQCTFTVTRILVLDPPLSVSIINVTTSSVSFALSPPNSTFDVYVATIQGPLQTVEVTFPAQESTLPVPNLMPDTNYTLQISTAVAYGTDNEVVSTPVTLRFMTVALDTTPPVITDCPSDITLPVGQSTANWTEPTAVDDSGVAPLVDRTHEPGAVFADEVTNITYTFTDAAGNSAQCVFTVTRILVLEPPKSVSIINTTTTSISFSVVPPNSTFDVYIVTVQDPLQTVQVTSFPARASVSTVVNLTPGTNYTMLISTAVANEVISTPITLEFTTVALDSTPPVITDCPSDITLPVGQSIANWTEPTAVDDSGVAPVVDRTHEPGAVFVDEVTNVTYTFTDASGNSAVCVFTVTRILILEPPLTITILNLTSNFVFLAWTPPNSTFEAYLVEAQGPSSTGEGIVPRSQLSLLLPGLIPGTNYTVSVSTIVAPGTADEIVSAPVSVTFTTTDEADTTPPMIIGCPSDITLPVGQSRANWTEPTAVDDSGLVPVVNRTHEPGAVFADEVTNVTYTFTDAEGNTAQCVFTVTRLQDTTPPVIDQCLSFVTLPAGSTAGTWVEPTATDDSGEPPVVNKSHELGSFFPEGFTTVTYTFTDAAGNQAECSFIVNRQPAPVDSTPPDVSGCPSDVVLPPGTTIANWTEPSATDDSGSPPSVVKSHEPGNSFPEGRTTVLYTFTDAAGNQANCSFTVTVTFDTTPPVISDCPADILLPFASTLANWTEPTASDNSGQPPSVVKTHEPGTNFSTGNTTVLYTFTDAAGNQANCSFVVTVQVDTTPPVISDCPADILLPFASTLANWTEPTATDNSGQPPSVAKTHEPGSDFGDGNTTVLYTFTDAAGNQANCSFVVTVEVDDVAPIVMNCPSNISIPFGSDTASWTEPTATDNSGEAPSVLRSHEPGASFLDETTMVTYTFTDGAGNQANCVFLVIRLQDDVAPVISGCPSVINLPPGENVATWDEPTAVDNSGQAPNVTATHESGSVFTDNVTMVVYTFTDGAGNQANCVFFVKTAPVDLPPVVFDCPANVTLKILLSELSLGIFFTWREPYAIDDSGEEPSLVKTHSPGFMFPPGSTTVVYTFTDGAGNQADCTFVVTVIIVDDVEPVFVDCPSDMDVTLPLTQTDEIVVTWQEPSATDNSGEVPSVNRTHQPGTRFPEGPTRVTYTFTDGSGNRAVCSFEVNVEREKDVTPPEIFNCPSDQAYIIPAGNQFMIVMWNPPIAVDNSGEQPTVESSRNPGDVFGEGTTVVVYNFTDPSGNVASCEFSITLSTPVLNPCQSRPCRPNENCFYSATDYICVPGPFRKKRDILNVEGDLNDDCPCENQGVCQRDLTTESTQCICPEGFSGILCQEVVAERSGRASNTSWQIATLASLTAVSLLSILLVVVYHSKRHQKDKLGYSIPNVAL